MTTTYDRTTLYARLREVASLAGELRYVDKVLAFVAVENQTPGAGPGGPAPQYFEINGIGRTFPFSRRTMKVPLPYGYEEKVSSFLVEAAGEARTWRDHNFESMLRLIEPLTHPHTTYYEEIVHRLVKCASTLEADPEEGVLPPPGTTAIRRTDFGMLNPNVWAGDAADSFRNNFYHPFKYDVRRQQAAFTRAVAAGFVGAKLIDDLAQISLLDVVTGTRDALLEQLRHRQQDTDGESKVTALIIAAVGTSILAVIAIPAPLLSASLGAISGALYFAASEAAEEGRQPEEFEGRSADDLFYGMYSMAGKTANNARGQYEALDLELGQLLEWGHMMREVDKLLIPARTPIAERDNHDKLNPDPDEFHHRS